MTETQATEPVENRLVQAALTRWGAQKNAQTMFNVLRHCATGQLLLDGTGSRFADPAHPGHPGDQFAIGEQIDNDGKRLLLVYTGNDRLAAHLGRTDTVSIVQAAPDALALALSRYDGIAIDPGNRDVTCIAYTAEIRQGLTDDPTANSALKTAIVRGAPAAEVIALVAQASTLFIAAREQRDERGQITRITVQNAVGPDGTYATAFSSPAEVWAWDPESAAHPTHLDNIVRVARERGQIGLVVNPGGPSLAIPVADLPATN